MGLLGVGEALILGATLFAALDRQFVLLVVAPVLAGLGEGFALRRQRLDLGVEAGGRRFVRIDQFVARDGFDVVLVDRLLAAAVECGELVLELGATAHELFL